jgi:acid phosphatase type 7
VVSLSSYPHIGEEFSPDQIHLTAWTENSVLISWATGEGRVGPAGSSPKAYDPSSIVSMVEYGESKDALDTIVIGGRVVTAKNANSFDTIKFSSVHSKVVYSYEYDIKSGAIDDQPSVYQSPIIHHTLVDQLTPGKKYYYRVGNFVNGWSTVMEFQMPRNEYPITLGVWADTGFSQNTTYLLDDMLRRQFDVVLGCGDYPYADNFLGNGTRKTKDYFSSANYFTSYQPIWDSYGRFLQPLASKVPFLMVSGNHEFESLVSRGNLSHLGFNKRYPMPQYRDRVNTAANDAQLYWDQTLLPGQTSFYSPETSNMAVTNNTYYSIDIGPVHIVGLNTYVPYDESSDMYQWFVKDMESVISRKPQWIIVQFHSSVYGTYIDHYKEVARFQSYFEPLFLKYKVDFVLNGHMHGYDRSPPVYNYQPNSCGPVYVTVGCGGIRPDIEFVDELRPDNPVPASYCTNISDWVPAPYQPYYNATPYIDPNVPFCYKSQAPFSDFRVQGYGYGMLEIKNSTHAAWKLRRIGDDEGFFIDDVMLVKHQGDCNNKVVMGKENAPNSNAEPIE